MKKWGVLAIFMFVLIAITVIVFFNKIKQKNTSTLPVELTINFDLTQNAAKFKIEELLENDLLSLKIVWPREKEGHKVISKVTCGSDDIKIMTKSNNNPQQITKTVLFEKMSQTPKEYMIFSGYCNNQECSEIIRGCELYVGQ